MTPSVVAGTSAWRISSDCVELCTTEIGGHLGPVTFMVRNRRIQPFAIAPWQREILPRETPPILRVLRGDFFCLPFGGNGSPFRGERHPVHGETANERWQFRDLIVEGPARTLHLSLDTDERPGRVDKKLTLINGQTVIYAQDIVSGMRGPMCFGHHAMLHFPDRPNSGLVSTSPFRFGQVLPLPFENPAQGGYSALKMGSEFRSLDKVKTADGSVTDLSRYPARRGFEDLVLVASRPRRFAWNAVVFPQERYVYFALRDPAVLASTILWISNGGRHYAPWNGRHVNILGIQDVTAYFHVGLAESAGRNHLQQQGIPTFIDMNPNRPLEVNYIMGIAPIPADFDHVADICHAKAGVIEIRSRSGAAVRTQVDLKFLRSRSAAKSKA